MHPNCNEHTKNQYLKAGRIDISADEIRDLAGNRLSSIRRRVAENHNAPRDVLEFLANDHVADVRVATALNPSTPMDVKFKVARQDTEARMGLAQEPETPSYLLQHLLEDENPYVAHHAGITLSYKTEGRSAGVFSEDFARHYSKILSPPPSTSH